MTLLPFHTFVHESTLLNEIGDASARPYKTRYTNKDILRQFATFKVENEDYDPNNPKKNWDDIGLEVQSDIEEIGINSNKQYMAVEFRRNTGGHSYSNNPHDTLDIGLKYLFRVMATVVAHVKNHIKDYEKARERDPKMKPLSGIYFISSYEKRGGARGLGKTQRDKLYKAYIEKSLKKMYPRAKVREQGYRVYVDFNKDQS